MLNKQETYYDDKRVPSFIHCLKMRPSRYERNSLFYAIFCKTPINWEINHLHPCFIEEKNMGTSSGAYELNHECTNNE